MHCKVPTGVYDGEVMDIYFGHSKPPCFNDDLYGMGDQCCASGLAAAGDQAKALNLARRGGMSSNKRRADQTPYYNNNQQFLYSRNRTVAQNETTLLRQGDPNITPGSSGGYDNVYASNTALHCPGVVSGDVLTAATTTTYYPVYHHPSNPQYDTQGAVTAAERMWRLRYNATMQTGPPLDTPYGVMQPNALAFVNGKRIFDLKDRIGSAQPSHPRVMPWGEVQCTPMYYPNVAFGPG